MTLKRILNRAEEATFRELQSIGSTYGYEVHSKVRLADVFELETDAVTPTLFSYALKAHFDFTVCDETHRPLFAVEFDGPSHREAKQIRRDAMKDELCEQFELPLLRINEKHLVPAYHKASLLRWLISAWELKKGFDAAQAAGQIPEEEGFDPIFLWHEGATFEERHPHWIAYRPRERVRQLATEGRIPSATICQFIFVTERGNYHGIAWVDVGPSEVVWVESGMRTQQFPVDCSDLFRELMTVLVYEELTRYLATVEGSSPPADVARRLAEVGAICRFASSHTAPSCVDVAKIGGFAPGERMSGNGLVLRTKSSPDGCARRSGN